MAQFKVFDIETREWNNIYAIGIYDGINVKTLVSNNHDNDYFIEWLFDNLDNNDLVYAHFGGRFDFQFILDFLSKDHSIKNVRFIHGSLALFTVKFKDKEIVFRDSFNILPSSLRKLTESFDVEHKKLEMDYALGTKDPRFREYFINDLKGLYEVLYAAPELREKLTIASNSMDVFLRKFYHEKISGNYDKHDNLFRKGYYGGRVEIFKMLGSNLHYYDVNSLYPYVMHEYEYPIIKTKNFKFSEDYDPDTLGIYKIRVEAPKGLYIPILPYRMRDKLLFPTGHFTGYYYTPEINKAIDLGYKIDVYGGYKFLETDYIFKDFVDHYYKIKQCSKGSKREIAKLYLNSLYGKFGQRREQDVYEIVKHSGYNADKSIKLYHFKNFKIQKKKTILSFIPYIHSEIAALVTCYARLKLFDMFEKCGLENVYYSDTDSVITSTELETGLGLGELKEEAVIKDYIAIAPKVYMYTTESSQIIKAKGLKSENLTYDDFEHAINTKDLSAFTSTFERLATFKEKDIRHLSKFTDKVKIHKMLKKFYDKRKLTSKFDTYPVDIYV